MAENEDRLKQLLDKQLQEKEVSGKRAVITRQGIRAIIDALLETYGQLDKKELIARMTEMELESQQAKAKLDQLKEQLQQLMSENDALKQRLQKAEAEAAAAQKGVADRDAQVAGLKQKYDQSLADLEQKLKQALDAKAAEAGSAQRDYEQKLAALQSELANKDQGFSKSQQDFEKRLAEMQAQLQAEMQRALAAKDQEMAALRQQYEQRLAELQAQVQQSLAAKDQEAGGLQQEFERQLAALRQQSQQALAEREQALRSREAELQSQLAQLQSALAALQQELEAERRGRASDIESYKGQTVAFLDNEKQRMIQELKNGVDRATSEADQRWAQRCQELEQYARNFEAREHALKQRIAELEKLLADAHAHHESLERNVQTLNNKLGAHDLKGSDAIKRIHALEEELKQLRDELARKERLLGERIRYLTSELKFAELIEEPEFPDLQGQSEKLFTQVAELASGRADEEMPENLRHLKKESDWLDRRTREALHDYPVLLNAMNERKATIDVVARILKLAAVGLPYDKLRQNLQRLKDGAVSIPEGSPDYVKARPKPSAQAAPQAVAAEAVASLTESFRQAPLPDFLKPGAGTSPTQRGLGAPVAVTAAPPVAMAGSPANFGAPPQAPTPAFYPATPATPAFAAAPAAPMGGFAASPAGYSAPGGAPGASPAPAIYAAPPPPPAPGGGFASSHPSPSTGSGAAAYAPPPPAGFVHPGFYPPPPPSSSPGFVAPPPPPGGFTAPPAPSRSIYGQPPPDDSKTLIQKSPDRTQMLGHDDLVELGDG